MTIPEKHFKKTRDLIKKVGKKKIADWLLTEGYFPEQYVLPPCFVVEKFDFKASPNFKVTSSGKKFKFHVDISNIETITFPKSRLTDKTFGIIESKIYHDLTWYIIDEWDLIIKHLFHKDLKIFSYSFPIPVTKKSEGDLGTLRAGRLIYEFLEMAENDLVAEAHKFKFILKTDVKNFYPSIYTHSISWALHGKTDARADRYTFALLGNKLDKLFQNSNDGCTNGLAIGPAISDMTSEILLTALDKECSKELKKLKIKFIGVRFKDDYRFLCNSKSEAEQIIKTLQSHMRKYNLQLNESKSELKELPEGLFRQWTSEYQSYSLKYWGTISYKVFENTLLAVLNIDQKYPDTGVIDKFLGDLTSKKMNLKLKLKKKEYFKVFSLILLLKERRTKSFPRVLAIIELMLERAKKEKAIIKQMQESLSEILLTKFQKPSENQYELVWLTYFLKSRGIKIKWPRKINNELLNSIKTNGQIFFTADPDVELFSPIKRPGKNELLLKHLTIFSKET